MRPRVVSVAVVHLPLLWVQACWGSAAVCRTPGRVWGGGRVDVTDAAACWCACGQSVWGQLSRVLLQAVCQDKCQRRLATVCRC